MSKYVRDKYRERRYLSDLFHEIIHEGSLYSDPLFKGRNAG